MPEFLHFDPFTGTSKYFDWDDSKKEAVITTVQDVQPVLDRAKETANVGGSDSGIKRSFWHYADIPPVVQLELRKKGIDIYSTDKMMIKRMFAEINANYPHCKLTHKKHV